MGNVSLQTYDEKYAERMIELWNSLCGGEVLYKPFTQESFTRKFLANPYFDPAGTFLLLEGEEVVGLASGIYRTDYLPGETFEKVPGYLTAVMVRRDRRGQGYGRRLVEAVENYLREKGKREVRADFFNPINLEWIIPGTPGHDHPNAPGVDTEGLGYGFLKKLGYAERAVEVSMYAPLNTFHLPEAILEKCERLREKGIAIEFYDERKHTGLESFFDRLKNEHWRKDINDNLSLERPYPFWVAASDGAVCGFAGPLEIEPGGRGRFCGIGVEPAFEGLGIGTTLFYKLCEGFKDIGAAFMSLFTGENNKARNIYASAGFEAVRRWSLFRKEL